MMKKRERKYREERWTDRMAEALRRLLDPDPWRFAVIIAFMLIPGCGKDTKITRMAKSAGDPGKTYFTANDPIGDDYGPGSYIYPESPDYNAGCFDLTRLSVVDAGKFVNIVIEFREEIINSQRHEGGWSAQLIDIYVDTDRKIGSGKMEALPGRNVKFKDYGWDKVILISPIRKERMTQLIEKKTEILELDEMWRDGKLILPEAVLVGPRTLVARVLKTKLGIPEDNWAWQAAVMGFNSFDDNPEGFYNMEIRTVATTSNFGGGSDFSGNPNIVDLLDSTNGSQEKDLSGWYAHPDPEQNVFAKIGFAQNSTGLW